MTAAEILAISVANAATLFPGGDDEIGAKFKRLALDWHPDRNKDPAAVTVMQHLMMLREAALGRAPVAQVREFSSAAGKTWRLRYFRSRPSDAGEILIGRRSVGFLISPLNADLAAACAAFRPKFDSVRMRQEMERFLPILQASADTTDGTLLIFERTPDQVLLSDLLAHTGPLDPVHVAWIISGLENIACWLAVNRICHGAIGPDLILVSPLYHSVALTGPFLFHCGFRMRPTALPERTIRAVPRIADHAAVADERLDLDLIRLTAREAIGDPSGARLMSSVPKPLAMWLLMPPAATAFDDYAGWEKAREEAFGPRKFSEMSISAEDIYA